MGTTAIIVGTLVGSALVGGGIGAGIAIAKNKSYDETNDIEELKRDLEDLNLERKKVEIRISS